MKGTRNVRSYTGGISIAWSVINQAYFVMWHDTVLRIFNDWPDATDYASTICKTNNNNN